MSKLTLCLLTIATAAHAAESYNATPTRFVEVSGTRYAYRSNGDAKPGVPLVLLNHFTGTLDDWDPAIIEGLAASRRVITIDNAGVGRSGGSTPDSVQAMAKVAVSIIRALKLKQVDLLGFSLGGCIAQQILIDEPELVRRAILAGTSAQGSTSFKDLQAVLDDAFKRAGEQKTHPKVPLFFTDTKEGREAGQAFVSRINKHSVDAEPAASEATTQAQAKALIVWASSPANDAALEKVRQPVLIVNGSNDTMAKTVSSYELFNHLPRGQLSLYPDSGHGALFQHHQLFVSQVGAFLDTSR